jgi:hypothetical protein
MPFVQEPNPKGVVVQEGYCGEKTEGINLRGLCEQVLGSISKSMKEKTT